MCRDDRLHRAQDLAQAHGVQGPVLAVSHRPHQPCDLVVNMVLRITVPACPLQPRRDRDQRLLEPAGLLAIDPRPVVAGPCHPGPLLHVLQSGPVGRLDDLLVPTLDLAPVGRGGRVARQTSPALVLSDGGVEDRDRLRERDRHVRVDRRLPGRLGCLPLELQLPLGCRVRLGRLQAGQMIGEPGVVPPRPA
jgi:hypothetical protein